MEHKKFGEMSREEKLELMAAWLDGETIEGKKDEVHWVVLREPWWQRSTCYRIAYKAAVKPSINWDHVAESFKVLMVNIDGLGLITQNAPILCGDGFSVTGKYASADAFASYDPGSFVINERGDVENWKDSIVYRPGHEPKGE